MELRKVVPGFPDMEKLEAVVAEAFPPAEYISAQDMLEMSSEPGFDFWALYDGDAFVGFMSVILHKRVAYLLLFAIDGKCRGKGYGGEALAEFAKKYPSCQHVLDIEVVGEEGAPNNEQRISRKAFYLRNGYKETGWVVSYSGEYEVLCLEDDFDPAMAQETLGMPEELAHDGEPPRFYPRRLPTRIRTDAD